MSLKLTITRRGLEAAISAKDKGLKAELTWVSAGTEAYTPNRDQQALVKEVARVQFGQYKDTGGAQMQAVAKFSGPDEFPIRELGFHLADGTLFGVISAPNTTLNYKAANGHCIQPFTLDLSALPTNSVSVVVGTENLNILIDDELAIMAKSIVDTQHIQIKHEFRLLELEKQARS